MSTHLYLTCFTHDPTIWSDEVGYNLSDLPAVREDIARRESLVTAWKLMNDFAELPYHHRRSRINFFVEHPSCEIGIIDEYGTEYSLKEDGPTPIDRLSEFLGKRAFGVDNSGTMLVFWPREELPGLVSVAELQQFKRLVAQL